MRIAALALTAVAGLAAAHAAQAGIVYNNLAVGTATIAGYTEPNTNNPIYGDQLNMTSGGTLSTVGFTIFNSSTGNTGAILTGSVVLKFYDNTTPYAGGAITNPLLGTTTVTVNFGAGLNAGFFSTVTTNDLSALNILLTQNILITQQFTQLTGTSNNNGVVLKGDPTVGTSPNNVYISSSATASNSYTFGGTAANSQFGYTITTTPAPGAAGLAGIAGLVALRRRRSR